MDGVVKWLIEVDWIIVIAVCLTLGLAPFAPPHIWEKLVMLSRGELHKPIDIFDLLMHGAPWLVLLAKAVAVVVVRR